MAKITYQTWIDIKRALITYQQTINNTHFTRFIL